MFSKLKIKITKPQRTQRHEGGRKNWPRSSEFFFHGEKRWWVAPADPESKPRLKLFSLEKSQSAERAVLQGDRREIPREPV